MRINYVLVDYENVQPDLLSILDRENFRTFVFVGANQSKVTFDVADAMQRMGARAEYVRISGSGHNALDFHIAFYIGVLSKQEPDAYFHIVSKDSGFDPLIQHLKSRKIHSCRSRDVSEIPLIRTANSKSPDDRLAVIIADLHRRGASRPRTMKTLSSTVSAIFQKNLDDSQLEEAIRQLVARGHVIVNGTRVTYSLPEK